MSEFIDIVVFDTETNGLDVVNCDMLSIGWIKIRKYLYENKIMIVERSEYFIKNDEIHNNETCFKINGIPDEFRSYYGVPIDIVLDRFMYSIAGSYVYAFNVAFDVGFVEKYRTNTFIDALEVGEIRINEYESVVNALQRIVNTYYPYFNHFVNVSDHLHSAFDDAWAELIILLHDKYNFDVSSFMIKTNFYEPCIGTGKYKNVPVNEVVKNDPVWIKWFIAIKESPYEDYLRNYILDNFKIEGLELNINNIQGINTYWRNIINQINDV